MRVAAYIRVSTVGQVEEGHSLEAQLQDIQTFASNKGWTMVEVYSDEGISGSLSERPGLTRILRDAEAGLFEVVMVHKVDRFFRDLNGFMAALKRLNDANVTLISVTQNIDFTSPWGKLALVILATIAEIFLDILKEETVKGKLQRARKGLWNGSIPFGYCNGICSNCTDPNGPGYCPYVGRADVGDGDNLVMHPIESVATRLMFDWYTTGQYSDGDIADKINAYEHRLPDGRIVRFRSKGRGGSDEFPPGPFGKDTIRSLLQRPFYKGVVTYKDQELPGNHPMIVEPELYERAQLVRRTKGHNPQSQRSEKQARVFLLTGILQCAECGGRMRGQSSNQGVRYYQCVNRAQAKADCSQVMVRADPLEEQLVEIIKHVRIPAEWREEILSQIFPNTDVSEIERRRVELKIRYDKAVELYLSDKIDREKLDQEELTFRREIALLTTGQNHIILEAIKLVTQFQDLWEVADPIEKKKLLQTMFEGVRVRGQTIESVQPKGPFYPFFEYWSSGSDGT